MATMASPHAGKTSANNNGWVRLPIDAHHRKVERGMTAVQPAGRSIKITHKTDSLFQLLSTPSNLMLSKPSMRADTKDIE